MSKSHSRRAVLAGIATAPAALAAPALALSVAGPDPIFALIEQHRAAVPTGTHSTKPPKLHSTRSATPHTRLRVSSGKLSRRRWLAFSP
jgi:hypothetical protein